MRHFLRAKSLAPFLWIGAVLAVPLPATAGNTGTNNDWQYSASIYLWGAGIDGETATGGEVDIRFETLISNLNMALMGSFEARKSEWSILTDVVYLNVGDDGAGRVPVTTESGATLPLKVDTGAEVKGWVLSFLGGYNVRDDEKLSVDVAAGARFLDLSLDFDFGLQPQRFGRPIDVSASDDVWDVVIGVRGHANLNRQWYLPYQLDIGAGQSDLTWQAAGGIGYRFDWGDVNLV